MRVWRLLLASLLVLACLGPVPAIGVEVYLNVERSQGRPLGMAIPSFNPDGVSGDALEYSHQMSRILTQDLNLYGYFAFVKNQDFLREATATDRKAGRIVFKEWAEIGAQMLVKGSYHVADGQVVFGSPARPAREFLRLHMSLAKLPQLIKDVKSLKKGTGEPAA